VFRFWLNHHQGVHNLCFTKLLYRHQLIYFVIKIVRSCGRMLIQSCLCVYRSTVQNKTVIKVIKEWMSELIFNVKYIFGSKNLFLIKYKHFLEVWNIFSDWSRECLILWAWKHSASQNERSFTELRVVCRGQLVCWTFALVLICQNQSWKVQTAIWQSVIIICRNLNIEPLFL